MLANSFWGKAFVAYADDNSDVVRAAFHRDFEFADRFMLAISLIFWLLVSTVVGGLHYGMFTLGIVGGGLAFGLSVDQINRAISQVNANTHENATLVERTTDASRTMIDIVTRLQTLSGTPQTA